MKLKFSDRIGTTTPSNVLQVNEMSIALRNSLWNYLLRTILNNNDASGQKRTRASISIICQYFFKLPLDELPSGSVKMKIWLRNIFFNNNFKWYDVYNLIEFISDEVATYDNFRKEVNNILEEEMSGYRYVGTKLAPITSHAEIESIASSIESAKANQLFGTAKHLETAVTLLSNMPTPDYRNSIKESISSVESLVKQITGEESGGLDRALAKFEANVKFHGAFKSGLLSLYGYTSDEHGIRHAILDEPNVGFDEAKFMIVTCSALVNFLISKANKYGLI